MSKCTGCGFIGKILAGYSEFEEGLAKRKSIYKPFPQAVPNLPVLDKNGCRLFAKGKCGVCKICPTAP